jgi:two-component system cell cycle sensor histidine kinase/response regulator CckA
LPTSVADSAPELPIAEAILDSVRWTRIAAVVGKEAGDSIDLQWMSEAFAELLGVTNSGESLRRELLSDPLLSIAAKARIHTGPVKTLVTSLTDTLIPVEVSGAVSSSERTYWAAVVSDTRSSHEIEEAVRRSEERFESLVESLVESVWIVRGGQVVYANSAALLLLQLAENELQSRSFLSLVHQDDQHQVEQWFYRVLQGEPVPPFECRLSQGQTQILVELSSIGIDYEGGGAILSFGRDVTERKRSEASLLQSDRLASLGMLAGGMAHSLNNPLTYVLLNLDHLAKRLPLMAGDATHVADALARMAEAREGAERMASIVKRMRNLARTDDTEIRAIDLSAVLESVVEIVGNEMHHRGRLTTSFEQVPPIVANESRIEQVCLGLVLFAARILPEDTAKTNEVRLALFSTDQQTVAIEIVCEGVELDAVQLRSLFEPFASSDEARTAGFGLSVCSSIVDQLGGQITAESLPGTGLSLTITFPCSRPSATTEPPPPSSQQSSSPPSSVSGCARILVIDDDPGVGRALRLMLEEDHDVTSFTSPREALRRLLQDQDFDLVFCDLMMPELTGMDIYQVLRFNRPGYEARLVFMTGGAFTAQAKRFLAQVPNPRIEKPFNLRALQRMVQRSIVKRS